MTHCNLTHLKKSITFNKQKDIISFQKTIQTYKKLHANIKELILQMQQVKTMYYKIPSEYLTAMQLFPNRDFITFL